jgi:probable HAF family extracellular repeat protein
MKRVSRLIVWGFGFATSVAIPAWAQTYQLIDLTARGVNVAQSINDSGQVAGGGPGGALIYSNGVVTNIGTVPGASVNDIAAISSTGDVTGTVSIGSGNSQYYHAFIYSNGQMTDIGTLPGVGGSSYGNGVNATGQITGTDIAVTSNGSGVLVAHAFLFSGGTKIDIGTPPGSNGDPSVGPIGAYGQAINATGQIAGYAYDASGEPGAFLYSNGAFQWLGTFGGNSSYAFAINDNGLTTGYAASLQSPKHAFISDGVTITDIDNDATGESQGWGINASGMVTGWLSHAAPQHAFLYANGVMTDLNSLVDPNDPLRPFVTLTNGSAINATGSIVADGTDSRDPPGSAPRVYLLVAAGTPIPPSFSASATTITVGTPVTLTWSGSTGSSCTATGGSAGDGWSGSLSVSGSKAVTESAVGQFTFVVSCAGTNGTAQAQLTVTMVLPTVTLNTNATAVFTGAPVLLTWTASPGTSCTATGGNSGDGWTGNLTVTGSKSVTESASGQYTYGITCTSGSFKAQAQASVSVAGPAVTLTASASAVLVGKPVTLTWNATQGSVCTATGGSSGDGWAGSLATSASKTVTESTAGTYTYGVTCTGGTQAAQSQVTVTVALPSVSLSAAPSTVTVGQSSTLTWSSMGPSACTGSGGGSGDGWAGSKAASGTASVTETAAGTYTYTLVCAYGAQSLQAVAVVTVNAPPKSSGGGGGLDGWALLALSTIFGLRGVVRRRAIQLDL